MAILFHHMKALHHTVWQLGLGKIVINRSIVLLIKISVLRIHLIYLISCLRIRMLKNHNLAHLQAGCGKVKPRCSSWTPYLSIKIKLQFFIILSIVLCVWWNLLEVSLVKLEKSTTPLLRQGWKAKLFTTIILILPKYK